MIVALWRWLRGYPTFPNTYPNFTLRVLGPVSSPQDLNEALETTLLRLRERLSSISMRNISRPFRGYLKRVVKVLQKNQCVRFVVLEENRDSGIVTLEDKKYILLNREILNNVALIKIHFIDGSVHERTIEAHDYLERSVLWAIMAIEFDAIASEKIRADIGAAAECVFPFRPVGFAR
jgi:hypothetical protein